MLEEEDIVRILNEMASKEGQNKLAERLGVSHSFMSFVLNKKRNVSDSLAGSLGYKRIIRFIKERK